MAAASLSTLDSLPFSADGERGFVVKLKDSLPSKWKCPLCNLLMRNAIQTYRGEMACESCYFSVKGNTKICPIDNEPIEDGEYFKDRHARREILQLPCVCTNHDNGCKWEGVVNDFAQHQKVCQFEYVSCDSCKEVLLRHALPQHLEELCMFRELACTYCGVMFNMPSMKEHESVCHMKPLECPYMCGENIQLKTVHSHVQQCVKILGGATCPFNIVGCDSLVEGQLLDHMKQNDTTHAALTVTIAKCLQQSNEKLKQELHAEQTMRLELSKKMQVQGEKQKTMEASLMTWKKKYEEMEGEIAKLREKSDHNVLEIQKNLQEIDQKLENHNVQDIGTRLSSIEAQYVAAEVRLRNNPASSPSAVAMDEELKKGVEKVDQLESGSAVLSANLSELELKLQLLENTCYDGQQLWKVDNVTYRINQAMTGKVTALHSAPCFQKRGGYKFCSRLYLNGDGMGRGTHVSLFFVIMKSEYDALLTWPFSDRVTFRLINPHTLEESMVESFIPDKNSSSFKRPTKDMNIAAGCPMFIRKELLSNYIVDDALYIETKIAPPSQ